MYPLTHEHAQKSTQEDNAVSASASNRRLDMTGVARLATGAVFILGTMVYAWFHGATPDEEDAALSVGDLTLNMNSKKAWRNMREITLTAREFALLSYLISHAGTVISRSRLLDNVWNIDFDPGTKVVDVYIRYLRQKIDEPGEESPIQTVRGFGYKLKADD